MQDVYSRNQKNIVPAGLSNEMMLSANTSQQSYAVLEPINKSIKPLASGAILRNVSNDTPLYANVPSD